MTRMSKWDGHRRMVRRLFDDLYTETCTVYEYTSSYTPGETFSGTEREHSESPVEVIFNLEETLNVEASGTYTFEEGNAVVRDDTGIHWVDYGEGAEQAMELERPNGRRYRLQVAFASQNGLLELEVSEVRAE